MDTYEYEFFDIPNQGIGFD